MAYQYEVDKIRELCDDVERVLESIEDHEDLVDEILDSIQGIRSEIDDVEGYTESNPDEVRSGLDNIIYTATNMRNDL